ncbi:hypothetical protein Tco_1257035 [Tanacetum coccineum]
MDRLDPKKYSELTEAHQLQDDCDVQKTNIILHGLPPDVYALVNHQEAAKDIWDRVKLLMKGTELSYKERECRLMTMQQVQVNTKFLNALPPEWSKFVINVKLAKSFYTTNYDQLYAYLNKHERNANEVRIMRERYPDPLALVARSQTLYNPSQSPQHLGSLMYPPPQQFTLVYAAPIHHQHHHTPIIPQQQSVSPQPFISLSVTLQSQAEFPQLDSGLAVPTFQQGEDPIDCINKAMTFLSAVASRFPPSNKQLRTSSNPRNQATIQDGRVTVQQYTQPKRPRSSAWFKEKLMLAEAQEAGQILDEEQFAFIKNSINSTVLIAKLSSCDSDVLSEVPYSDTYLNDMVNQEGQEIPYSEQTHIVDFLDNEINSDSNIIPYSQYLQELQDTGIQDTNYSTPNGLLVLSLVE